MNGIVAAGWLAVMLVAQVPERRVAVMPPRYAGVDAQQAETVLGSVRHAVVAGLRETTFTVLDDRAIRDSAAEFPSCVKGACDLEIGRRAKALVLVSSDVVEQEGRYHASLRMYETDGAQLLALRQVEADSLDTLNAQVPAAVRELTAELIRLDADALAAMAPAPDVATPQPAPLVRTPHRKAIPAEDRTPTFPQLALVAGGAAAVVAGAWLLAPLLLVPVVNIPVALLFVAHPFVAAGVAWLLLERLADQRVPLLPIALGAGLVELGALVACLPPVALLCGPAQFVTIPLFIASLSVAHAGAALVLARLTGRPRADGERSAFNLLSVPPAPNETGEIDETPPRLVPSSTPPPIAWTHNPAKPYRLVPRPRAEPPPPVREAARQEPAEALPIPDDSEAPEDLAPPTPDASARRMIGIIEERLPHFRDCYEDALRTDGKLSGRIVVGFTLDGEGTVSDVRLETDEIAEPKVGQCVVERFRRLRFPPPGEAPLDASFAFSFTPEDDG